MNPPQINGPLWGFGAACMKRLVVARGRISVSGVSLIWPSDVLLSQWDVLAPFLVPLRRPVCMVVALRLKSYHLDVMSYSSIVRFFFVFFFLPQRKFVIRQHLDVYLSESRCLRRLSVLKREGVYFQLSSLMVILRLTMPGWIIATL